MKTIRVRVMHSYFPCETGCCGHVVVLEGDDPEDGKLDTFRFAHSDGDKKEFAQRVLDQARETLEREFGPDHCFDLDWEGSDIKASEEC